MGRRSRRDDRGAVLPMVAVMVSVLVIFAAFAVDLGMQRVVRRDMQALADVVALDMARLLDGRTADQIQAGDGHHPSLAVALAASVGRNEDAVLGDPPAVTATLVSLDAQGEPVRNPSGALVPVTGAAKPDAVVVDARTAVDFGFASGSGGASRSAVAAASSHACFRLGSFAATLRSGDASVAGVFEAIVGDALGLNLKAVGYEGLLQTFVDLPMLAARLGAGTADQLAELPSVKVADLLSASAYVLGRQGDSAAQSTVLKMSQQVSQTLRIDLADVLTVGAGSVLEGRVNVIDLLGSAALSVATVVSNGNNFLDTGVAWTAPHVAKGVIALEAIEAPKQACGIVGVAEASTAQVRVGADLAFTLPNKVTLDGLGDLTVGTPADPTSKAGTLHVEASVAGATGRLVSTSCGVGTVADPEMMSVAVSTGLLTTHVSLPFRLQGTLNVTGGGGVLPLDTLNSLVGSLVSVLNPVAKAELVFDLRATTSITVSTPPQVAGTPTDFKVPPRAYGDAEATSAGAPVSLSTPSVMVDPVGSTVSLKVTTVLGDVDVKQVMLSSLNLTSVLSAISSTLIGSSVDAVVANINSALVPISKLLGIRVGGADLIGVGPPACAHPALVG